MAFIVSDDPPVDAASSDLFCTHPAVADPPAPNDKLRAAMTSIGGALIRDD